MHCGFSMENGNFENATANISLLKNAKRLHLQRTEIFFW